ncbi:MAG: hypothetical protein HYX92_14190 [Chloroflexi bacterium]|nr:hypothetical protein [Chloroflexota bacterium]
MTEPSFWRFRSPESTRKSAEWADNQGLEGIECPAHPEHKRAGERVNDLNVLLRGRPVDDIVWTWYSECLVQEHVLALFKEKGFTGYEVRPVRAQFKNKSFIDPPELSELVVTGWAGMAPPESGVKLTYSCPFCGSIKYSCFDEPSRLIAESQWDGSDFFMVWPLPKFIFITDRVAQLLRDRRVTGFRLVRPDDLKCDFGGFSPGRLSHWMPKARARELGEPLGIY